MASSNGKRHFHQPKSANEGSYVMQRSRPGGKLWGCWKRGDFSESVWYSRSDTRKNRPTWWTLQLQLYLVPLLLTFVRLRCVIVELESAYRDMDARGTLSISQFPRYAAHIHWSWIQQFRNTPVRQSHRREGFITQPPLRLINRRTKLPFRCFSAGSAVEHTAFADLDTLIQNKIDASITSIIISISNSDLLCAVK